MLRDMATHAPDHAQGQEEGQGGYGVEAGVMNLLTRMQTGRLRVGRHLEDWWQEFRLYHRKDGKLVKERDDLMDATRMALMMLRKAVVKPLDRGLRLAPRRVIDEIGVLGAL